MPQERKIVTVLFCDLVGFTSRAEEMDPEDVAALLGPYHARVKAELELFGGTVEKFIGDAVMALFGAPVAHEDDPERAVRAALAIRDFARGEGFELRIGVTTGEALVDVDARPDAGETMAAGDVVNTAARLQAAAPVNGIVVSHATFEATRHVIEYTGAEPVEAKGKALPVAVWEAVAAPPAQERAHTTPLVGRESELAQVRAALERASTAREPQLVTIVGAPGIGKSRLVYEAARVDGGLAWRKGRCLPYGDGVTFWALGEIVKAELGILESDSPAVAEAKLVESVEDPWVAGQLRPLVGLAETVRETLGDRRAEAFAAWRRFLAGLAAERPVVLVLEDLHWADDALLDFVLHLVGWASDSPLVLLCTARPELLERRPGWGASDPRSLTVPLAPLSDDETAELFTSLTSGQAGDELLARAGGNPLYAEQYARLVTEHGSLDELPAAVQGIIAARLDVLPDEDKALVQQAAVVGRVFWSGAVATLSGADRWTIEERLLALERREVVRRERISSVEGETQYAFRHILLRDVAYAELPRAERGEKHRLAADWIESLGRPDDHAEMLAHHLGAAIDFGQAAGLDVTPLHARAAKALREAGDRAWALGAPAAALGFWERARSLDPTAADDPYLLVRIGRALISVRGTGDDELARAAAALADSDPAAAAEAEMLRGELIWFRGDRDAAFLNLDRAAAAVHDLPASRPTAYVVSQLARFLTLAGRHRAGYDHAERAIAMAEELGDAELLGDSLNTRGLARGAFGDPAWADDLERSLALTLEANSRRAARAYVNLAVQLLDRGGEMTRADQVLREGLRFAESLDLHLGVRAFRALIAGCSCYLGLWDEAVRLAEVEIDDAEPFFQQQWCWRVRSRVRLARGDANGSVADAEAAAEAARAIRNPDVVLPSLAWRAFCAASTGDAAGADAALAELAEARRAVEEVEPFGDWVLGLAFTLLELEREAQLLEEEDPLGVPTLWRDAALATAQGDLVRAADICAEIGSKPDEAYLRLRAAERLVAQGRVGEAGEQLERSLEFWRSVDATRYVAKAEALLAAAS